MERAKGNIAGAISLLQKYLDTNQMDKDAWEELADLYLQVCQVFPVPNIYCALLKTCVADLAVWVPHGSMILKMALML